MPGLPGAEIRTWLSASTVSSLDLVVGWPNRTGFGSSVSRVWDPTLKAGIVDHGKSSFWPLAPGSQHRAPYGLQRFFVCSRNGRGFQCPRPASPRCSFRVSSALPECQCSIKRLSPCLVTQDSPAEPHPPWRPCSRIPYEHSYFASFPSILLGGSASHHAITTALVVSICQARKRH